VASDEKYQKEEIIQLISKGKRQGFLSWEEIDQTFADEVGPEDDFDNFLSSMDSYGIKILDSQQREILAFSHKKNTACLHGLERTTDPVKLYLREMGNIPLLTREGEISIAREIERGEKAIIKALSKTRLVLNYLLEIEHRITDYPETIQKYFDFNDEELAEDRLSQSRTN